MNDRMKIKETELGLPYSHDVNVNKLNDDYNVLIKIELLNFKEDIMITESCISLTY